MDDLDSLELKYLRELIPDILFNKIVKLNLTTIGDIRTISVEDFRKYRSVGVAVETYLIDFQNLTKNKPEQILVIYNQNYPKSLPSNFLEETNFLHLFKSIIEELLGIIETYRFKTTSSKARHLRNIDMIRKTFGLNSKIYDYDKIATRHRINRERVRQIIQIEFIPEIKKLINGEALVNWNCSIRPEVVELIQSYKKDLAGLPILNEYKIELWLKEYGIELSDSDIKNYFTILLSSWGYEKIGLSRHYLLRNNIFYADESINQTIFLEISTKIVTFLREKVVPTSFDDIVIEVLEESSVEDDFIRLVCDVNFDIEKSSEGYYQIKFEKLSSINDFAYRILYEKQKELTYNELFHLINKRLVQWNKEISLESLKHTLRKDSFIVPVGKTGIWTLKDLNTNIESQINLILKTFRTLDKPLTASEITLYINEVFKRKDVTARSIGSNLLNYKKYFIKLKGNRFALFETSKQYAKEIVKTNTPIKRKITLKSEEIAEKSIEVLKKAPNNEMKLKDLIRILTQTNSSFGRMAIYKSISENPLVFKKENSTGMEKTITLFSKIENPNNELATKYKWNDLKKILERELSAVFNSSIQPSYSINLDFALDIFFKIIVSDVSVSCPELSGLADRILPTLNKFYLGASDRNDKLNYLKQIVTSQESYFKKLLYIVNNADYILLRSNKKGFGAILDKLSKIDTRHNRYKDINSASNFEFGKHCSRAYNNRNLDTHNAKNWTEPEIIDTKTSCIVFMVYGAFEYYSVI